MKFIINQKLTNQPIHLIWYCFKGSRFEESEDSLIKKIRKLNIPVLLVYTQCICDELMDFESLTKEGYEYIKIISRDMGKFGKSYGLDELKLKTNEYINNNYKKILKDIVIVQNIHHLKKEIINLVNNTKNNLNKDNFSSKINDILKLIYNINIIDDDNLMNNIKLLINNINNVIKKFVISTYKGVVLLNVNCSPRQHYLIV